MPVLTHIKTSQWIRCQNQLTGFYMRATLVFNGLRKYLCISTLLVFAVLNCCFGWRFFNSCINYRAVKNIDVDYYPSKAKFLTWLCPSLTMTIFIYWPLIAVNRKNSTYIYQNFQHGVNYKNIKSQKNRGHTHSLNRGSRKKQG